MWWKKRIDLLGSVYYPGAIVPTLESLEGLDVPGLEVERTSPGDRDLWAATLRHRAWGEALVRAPRETLPVPSFLVDFALGLTDADRARIRRAGACVLVSTTPREGDVLRDRKQLLRFLSALLGDDGIVAVDAASQLLWTRGRLDDELVHDAALDIDQIHVLHCVGDEAPDWIHSHGLAEIGFVDFDVLRAHASITNEQFDLLRALAFAVVEGRADEAFELASGASVELVDVGEFARRGPSVDVALRDPEGHSENRRVVCDPRGERAGFFRRLFRGDAPVPSRLFRKGMDPTRQLVAYSNGATELVATRARETIDVFDAFREEFAFLEANPLVKLGYRVDGAGGDDEREHLWFEVHGLRGDRIDATLLNQPFRIARMHEGQRDDHDLGLLSDWTIFTPMGAITPRSLGIARAIRENREGLEAMVREAKANGETPEEVFR